MPKYTFPEDFAWGTATASYQIEGAVKQDGRGETIWDRFCQMPGNILHNDNGNEANDHYNRYKEDVAMMKDLGHNSYRFSVCWARVMPNGQGEVSEKGIGFYSNLVDECLKNGIEPYVTLYHWDLPQALQDQGGWQNENSIGWFEDYCKVLFERLGDRVTHWITLNEPYCTAFLGNYTGEHAPGMRDLGTAILVSYNLLRAHGAAVRLFRKMALPGKIGITLNFTPSFPASDSEQDKLAAQNRDGYANRWFIDGVLKGSFPQDTIALYKELGITLPDFEDAASMCEKLDFVGVNYYFTEVVRYNQNSWPFCADIIKTDIPYTDRGWPIDPNAFTNLLMWIHDNYDAPVLYVTENGASYNDVLDRDGKIADYNRINYLQQHFIAVKNAMDNGADIRGYFVWSLYDNFEWAFGRYSRFGIIYEDFDTHKRTPKQSAYWLRDVIRNNGFD